MRSEPEAAAVRDVAVAFRPHAWVNVHSGMEGLFMPYDHVAAMPDGPDAAAALAILQVPMQHRLTLTLTLTLQP